MWPLRGSSLIILHVLMYPSCKGWIWVWRRERLWPWWEAAAVGRAPPSSCWRGSMTRWMGKWWENNCTPTLCALPHTDASSPTDSWVMISCPVLSSTLLLWSPCNGCSYLDYCINIYLVEREMNTVACCLVSCCHMAFLNTMCTIAGFLVRLCLSLNDLFCQNFFFFCCFNWISTSIQNWCKTNDQS